MNNMWAIFCFPLVIIDVLANDRGTILIETKDGKNYLAESGKNSYLGDSRKHKAENGKNKKSEYDYAESGYNMADENGKNKKSEYDYIVG